MEEKGRNGKKKREGGIPIRWAVFAHAPIKTYGFGNVRRLGEGLWVVASLNCVRRKAKKWCL